MVLTFQSVDILFCCVDSQHFTTRHLQFVSNVNFNKQPRNAEIFQKALTHHNFTNNTDKNSFCNDQHPLTCYNYWDNSLQSSSKQKGQISLNNIQWTIYIQNGVAFRELTCRTSESERGWKFHEIYRISFHRQTFKFIVVLDLILWVEPWTF